MAAIGKVSLRGITHDDFQYTFLVKTGGAKDAVEADAGVKAVSMHTVANTVKLALDGEKILGRLEVIEFRTAEGIVTGTVALKGGTKFICHAEAGGSPSELPAVGDYIVGNADVDLNAGFVRKASQTEREAGKDNWLVVEVGVDAADTDYVIAINV